MHYSLGFVIPEVLLPLQLLAVTQHCVMFCMCEAHVGDLVLGRLWIVQWHYRSCTRQRTCRCYAQCIAMAVCSTQGRSLCNPETTMRVMITTCQSQTLQSSQLLLHVPLVSR